MDSIENQFSNQQLFINLLPDYRAVDFEPISKKKLTKSVYQISIGLVIFLVGWGILFYLIPLHWSVFLGLVVILFLFSFSYFNAYLLQPRYGYALREKDIIYRRGYLVSKTTVIPFNRIQHVSISRGIFDKALNISTLKIFTAGGQGSDVSIPGLLPDLAVKLKEAVAQKLSVEEDE
ncbi:PH domain-containing protein [Mesonia aestuariivivens]|uniref:PH domain-containing protein n=1 Tax=Mesonia aestuariivivens TaxID=2796128 RepID=A0ABS6W0P3_9FLAO|nr:PH domain-containing protein [Mesonia aestuariivivens]MBW2961404.1 PH domain-containing protein [Mesonia aestuariivivens]